MYRDVLDALPPHFCIMWRSLCCAMLHYMRFTEEHAGADVQKLTAFNVEVRSRREDATANLRRYAKLLERHCPDNLLTAQLHTLVCRISAQERATGCTGMNGELWME